MRIGGQGEFSSFFYEALLWSLNCSVEWRRPSISTASRSESRSASSFGTALLNIDFGLMMGLVSFALASYRSLSPAPDKVGLLLTRNGSSTHGSFMISSKLSLAVGKVDFSLIANLDGSPSSISSGLRRRSMAEGSCADNLANSAKETS